MDTLSLLKALGVSPDRAQAFAPWVDKAFINYAITTPLRKAGFLGNVLAESGMLKTLKENLNYTAIRMTQVWPSRFPTVQAATPYAGNPTALAEKVYAGRMGNLQPGDGGKFLGRGAIQLTGRELYTAYAKATGVDVVAMPELLEAPQHAIGSAGWFWSTKGCNALCDASDWPGLTSRINGVSKLTIAKNPSAGAHAERLKLINKVLEQLK